MMSFIQKIDGSKQIINQLANRVNKYKVREKELSQVLEAKVRELYLDKKQIETFSTDLQKAKNETDLIFKNVNQGLFLIDKKLNISSQFSLELLYMFNKKTVENLNVLNLLDGCVTDKVLNSAKDYFNLKFNSDIEEDDVDELNPLLDAEIVLPNENGKQITKYFSFKSARIVNNDEINNVLVTVNDITNQVNLQKKLEEIDLEKKGSMELIFQLIRIDPQLLDQLMKQFDEALIKINQILKIDSAEADLKENLSEISRIVHKLKGNSASIQLDVLADSCHKFETKINDIKDLETIKGDDFLSLVLDLKELRNLHSKLLKEFNFLKNYHLKNSTEKRILEVFDLGKSINQALASLNQKFDMNVNLHISGFQLLPDHEKEEFNDVFIQLMRNSFAHGFKNKDNERLMISISIQENSDSYYLIEYSDNGVGLNIEKIKEKMRIDQKNPNLEIDNNTAIKSIFKPGFSTSELNDVSGRGVGMDIVMKKIKDLKGKIKVTTIPNKMFKIVIIVNPRYFQSRKTA